jgi:hypothetical protein
MTGEEMERAIEFLLQSQANFDARLDRSQAEFEARLQRLEAGLEQTNQQVAETGRQLQAYAETQTEFIQIVTTAMQGLAAAQSRTDERLVQTDERLNTLADLVERIISEGRNGHA